MSGCSASSSVVRDASAASSTVASGFSSRKRPRKRLADQHMVVDDKDLHRKDRLQIAARSLERFLIRMEPLARAEVYVGPGTKAWGRCVANVGWAVLQDDMAPEGERAQSSFPVEDDDGKTLEV